MAIRPWRVVAIATNRVVGCFRKLKRAVAHAFAIGGAVRHVTGAQWVSIEPCDAASFAQWIHDCLTVRRDSIAALRRAAARNAAKLGMLPRQWRRICKSYPDGANAAVMTMAFQPHKFGRAA